MIRKELARRIVYATLVAAGITAYLNSRPHISPDEACTQQGIMTQRKLDRELVSPFGISRTYTETPSRAEIIGAYSLTIYKGVLNRAPVLNESAIVSPVFIQTSIKREDDTTTVVTSIGPSFDQPEDARIYRGQLNPDQCHTFQTTWTNGRIRTFLVDGLPPKPDETNNSPQI